MVQKGVILAVSLAAALTLNAGQIQIGQVVNGVNDGLTTTYVTSGVGSIGASNGLVNYDTGVFSGATPAPTPFTGYGNTGTTGCGVTSCTMTDNVNGITFDMINQSGSNGNAWANNSTNSIVVPIGVFGVTSVWTMLNDEYGLAGTNDTNLIFTFDGAANGSVASNLTVVTVKLRNGNDIRDAVDCTQPAATCTSLNDGTTLAATTTPVNQNSATTVNGVASATTPVTIVANNLFSAGFTSANNPYNTVTQGNLVLDDQGFNFGLGFTNLWLVSVAVSNDSGVNGVSRAALSAITVASPEPSTVLLLLSGIGLLALGRYRRA